MKHRKLINPRFKGSIPGRIIRQVIQEVQKSKKGTIMEPHPLDDIIEELKETQAYKDLPDKPEPWYNPYGDCIQYQWTDEETVGDWVNEYLTLYRSPEDHRIIGFSISGISHIIPDNWRKVEESNP
jgi:hypothetical protein